MDEFIQVVVVLAGGVVTILFGAAFALKLGRKKPAMESDVVDRIRELESRIAELEERLDFAERALIEIRGRAQIPKE
jgi:uncharacterized protein YceH (UPF0502 family)